MLAYFTGVTPGSQAGHYCHEPGYIKRWSRDAWLRRSPWGSSIYPLGDGAACAAVGGYRNGVGAEPLAVRQPEGRPTVLHKDGWTLLHLWDRSADSHSGSHASFAFDEVLDAEEALAWARQLFPEVIARIEKHLGRALVAAEGPA